MTGELIIVALIAAGAPTLTVILNERNRRAERRMEKLERDTAEEQKRVVATARNDQTQEKLAVIHEGVNGSLLTKIDLLRIKTVEEVKEAAREMLTEFRAELAAERVEARRKRK